MKKIALLMLGVILSSMAVAKATNTQEIARHIVTLAGLQPGEGRYIRSDVFENNQFKKGYYFCAGANSTIYDMEYFFSRSQEAFYADHITRFSICQDETLANCQEFATDKYSTLRSLDGYLKNDISTATVDLSTFKAAYQSCEPSRHMDEMVKKSIHLNDRVFAHVG